MRYIAYGDITYLTHIGGYTSNISLKNRMMQSGLALLFWILPLDLLEAGVELPFRC